MLVTASKFAFVESIPEAAAPEISFMRPASKGLRASPEPPGTCTDLSGEGEPADDAKSAPTDFPGITWGRAAAEAAAGAAGNRFAVAPGAGSGASGSPEAASDRVPLPPPPPTASNAVVPLEAAASPIENPPAEAGIAPGTCGPMPGDPPGVLPRDPLDAPPAQSPETSPAFAEAA